LRSAGYRVDVETGDVAIDWLTKKGIALDDKGRLEFANSCCGDVRSGESSVGVVACQDIRGHYDITSNWWIELYGGLFDGKLLRSIARILIASGAKVRWGLTGCNRLFLLRSDPSNVLMQLCKVDHGRIVRDELLQTPEPGFGASALHRIRFEIEGVTMNLYTGGAIDCDSANKVSFLALEYSSWLPWKRRRLESISNKLGCLVIKYSGRETDIWLRDKPIEGRGAAR
jgi:hypothetical protein